LREKDTELKKLTKEWTDKNEELLEENKNLKNTNNKLKQ
jgi:hypothetical protein